MTATTQTETIVVTTGAEFEATAKRIATERGLRQQTNRGYVGGLAPVGPSISLYDDAGRCVVRVVYDRS